MTDAFPEKKSHSTDSGLVSLCAVASYYRIPADPNHIARELCINERHADLTEILRAAQLTGLRARQVRLKDEHHLRSLPVPSIAKLKDGRYCVYSGLTASGSLRLIDPLSRLAQDFSPANLIELLEPTLLLVQRRFRGAGVDPKDFSFRWFLPSIWRYRQPIAHVLIASLFVQIFALITPLFFQVIVDKVLVHKSVATLMVVVAGLSLVGVFDITLQYLRTYALSHTTNRIDVELGQRLFRHLLSLPLEYFETRPAGQTVARMRELENIRTFLTGQGLFSAIDFVFALVFIAVLFCYSTKLALIVIATIPLYILTSALIRPGLRDLVKEKFNRGAESQQFLVESVVGIETLKASAVEPAIRQQWEERLAAYVRTAFEATMRAAGGQNTIQLISKLSSAAVMLFGAIAAIEGEITIGELIAFNMIASQLSQPVLRLSQLWQDFQQVQISIERLGDILNATPERISRTGVEIKPPSGSIEFRNVSFAYKPGASQVIKEISMQIHPGEVIGIIGASGSGKSTITKLIQRLYVPSGGQILVDGVDISQVDPSWIRSSIGVVLQENLLFNRSIHENIAFSNPTLPRAAVMKFARLSGADEFISRLPQGYDTMIEERGSNLSGGQRQRIAIARALATNPPILIFDEATSVLDYDSERLVQANMRHIVRGRTVIIIAHRLSTVRNCNRIFGVADGGIVEVGSHEDLLRSPGGLYARLWAAQSGAIVEAVA